MISIIIGILVLFFVGIPLISAVGFDVITAICIAPLILMVWAAMQL